MIVDFSESSSYMEFIIYLMKEGSWMDKSVSKKILDYILLRMFKWHIL
jgi:hypothetical protein